MAIIPELGPGLGGARRGAWGTEFLIVSKLALRMVGVLGFLAISIGALAGIGTPHYEIGELAEENIHAPTSMAVVDRSRTTVLRDQASRRIPAIFRFHSNAIVEAEAEMRASFVETRARFLTSMRTASGRSVLDARTIALPSFGRFVIWFQNQHPHFPISSELAATWAAGQSDDAFQESWARRLRAAMEQCIHGDWQPPQFMGSLSHVRVVQVDDPGEVLMIKSVENRSVDIKLTNLVSISQSRAAMKQGSGPESDPAVGNYLAGFLRMNCFPEEELTRQIREQSTTDMVAVDRYEEGQLIVRRGQRVDSRIRAALEFLNQTEKSVRARPVSPASDPGKMAGSADEWWRPVFSTSSRLEFAARWGLFLTAFVALIGLLLLAVLVRRKGVAQQKKLADAVEHQPSYTVVMNEDRHETIFMPLEAARDEESLAALATAQMVGLPPSDERFWRQRAVEAERRAEDIINMVRAGLAPQLARRMMNKLVQELITQRAEWLETSKIAESELADIERRFAASHALLQKRLRDFEKRTEELEKQLALKTEENSELIKNQIALTQQQLKEAQDSLNSDSDSDKEVLIWN